MIPLKYSREQLSVFDEQILGISDVDHLVPNCVHIQRYLLRNNHANNLLSGPQHLRLSDAWDGQIPHLEFGDGIYPH